MTADDDATIRVPAPRAAREASGAQRSEDLNEAELLELVAKELAEEVAKPNILIDVKTRKGYALAYSTDVPRPLLSAWQRKAKDVRSPGELNSLQLATTVIANQCVGVYRLERPITEAGQPVTFTSTFIRDMTGATDTQTAIQRFFGKDGHLEAHANAVLVAAGYNEEVEPDPTPPR